MQVRSGVIVDDLCYIFPLFEHFKAAIEFQINADFESQFVVSNAIVEWEQISIARNTLLKSIDFKELANEFVDPRILFDKLPFFCPKMIRWTIFQARFLLLHLSE